MRKDEAELEICEKCKKSSEDRLIDKSKHFLGEFYSIDEITGETICFKIKRKTKELLAGIEYANKLIIKEINEEEKYIKNINKKDNFDEWVDIIGCIEVDSAALKHNLFVMNELFNKGKTTEKQTTEKQSQEFLK